MSNYFGEIRKKPFTNLLNAVFLYMEVGMVLILNYSLTILQSKQEVLLNEEDTNQEHTIVTKYSNVRLGEPLPTIKRCAQLVECITPKNYIERRCKK